MPYQEPALTDLQVFWDIDDAITCLKKAASALRNGDQATAQRELAFANTSTILATEKVGNKARDAVIAAHVSATEQALEGRG